jgi:chemotaxis protein histidine kinase CheA
MDKVENLIWSYRMDQELINIFNDEIGELKTELVPILEELKSNNQQQELFKNFAQIIDRIYGTATTMGFDEIGAYLGLVRNLSRKASSSNIPRGMTEVFKIAKNCSDNFPLMQKSLRSSEAAKELSKILTFETKKMNNIEKEIFSFSKEAKSSLK